MVLATYQKTGQLLGGEREPLRSTEVPAGAPAFFIRDDCSPGNVYSLDGENLPGLGASVAAIPPGLSGTPALPQLSGCAGQIRLCNVYRNFTVTPEAKRSGVLLSARYSFSDVAELFTEWLASHSRVEASALSGLLVDAAGGAFGGTTLGAENPYNPFGQPVGISFSYDGLRALQNASSDLIRPLVGIRGRLFTDWHYELTAHVSRDRLRLTAPSGADPVALQAALDASDPAQALNPFSTQTPGNAQLLRSLMGPATRVDFDNRVTSAQALIRGPLFSMRSGPLETALGVESREEKQNTAGYFLPVSSALSRNTYALFGEGRMPLAERVALTAAARFDHTNDFGDKTTWQAGMTWRATEALSLAATHGISYRAPQLQEIGGTAQVFSGVNFGLIDPLRANEPVMSDFVAGPNPGLKPQTGDSYTLGAEYRSKTPRGVRVSLTGYSIDMANFIFTPAAQTLIDNASLFPGAIVRASASPEDIANGRPGPITSVNSLYYNYGDFRVRGLDADAGYTISTAFGDLSPSLAVSHIFKWQSALTPGSPSISYVSRANSDGTGWAPRWKGNVSLGWARGVWSAGLAGRYLGRYRDYQNLAPNTNELGDVWRVDANAQYELEDRWARSAGLRGAHIAASLVDLFSQEPPHSWGVTPYDPFAYDIRGRIFRLQVGVRW
jgi:iron complex outermembrane receptor protein